MKVAVSGAAGDLGRLVLDHLLAVGVEEVVAADLAPAPGSSPRITRVVGDLTQPSERLRAELRGCSALIHLAWGAPEDQQRLTSGMLEAAEAAGIDHVTFVSSAMVYGAWPNNPIPISEDAPLRPNPECSFAVAKADSELAVWQWRRAREGRTATLLRPAPAMSATSVSAIGDAMLAAAPVRTGSDDPPTQLVHYVDLATAVARASTTRLDGAFNVAADGWLSGEELRALLGARPRLRVPLALPNRLDRFVARRARGPVPTGILAYTRYPWAVANDRLRATGWSPKYGNDQTFVAADAGVPWDSMNARQRQFWSLGIGAVAIAAAVIGTAIGVRRWRRRRH